MKEQSKKVGWEAQEVLWGAARLAGQRYEWGENDVVLLQSSISNPSNSSLISIVRSVRENESSKSGQPQLTRLEFPRFNGDMLKWLDL